MISAGGSIPDSRISGQGSRWPHLPRNIIALSFWALVTTPAAADNLFNTNTLTWQQGDGFKLMPPEQQILTLEHYSLWSWGDFYAFYDRLRATDTGDLTHYSEWSPRFNLVQPDEHTEPGRLAGVLLAGSYEHASDGYEAFLAGIGLDWNVPPFTVLSTNLYYRDSNALPGHTWQLTTVWILPFELGSSSWLFEGYLDLRGGEGPASSDQFFNSQLKLDFGSWFGVTERFYAGVEVYYWNDKFGVPGVNERVVAPLVQFRGSF